MISRNASTANNLESTIWNAQTQTARWRFLTIPQSLRDKMVAELAIGM